MVITAFLLWLIDLLIIYRYFTMVYDSFLCTVPMYTVYSDVGQPGLEELESWEEQKMAQIDPKSKKSQNKNWPRMTPSDPKWP